jgi:hypothetical protein
MTEQTEQAEPRPAVLALQLGLSVFAGLPHALLGESILPDFPEHERQKRSTHERTNERAKQVLIHGNLHILPTVFQPAGFSRVS